MKTNLKWLLAITTLLVLCCFVTVPAFAQADVVPAAEQVPGPDLTNVALPGGIPAVTVLALLGTVIVSVIKFFLPKIPSRYVPFIAPVVTVLLDWLGTLTFGTSSNVWLALGAGVASIGLFELKKQALAKKPASASEDSAG